MEALGSSEVPVSGMSCDMCTKEDTLQVLRVWGGATQVSKTEYQQWVVAYRLRGRVVSSLQSWALTSDSDIHHKGNMLELIAHQQGKCQPQS